jgi:hypothetical protein
MHASLPDIPLRSDTFAVEDRWLFRGRARLYPDRLELTGWSLAGRRRREIALGRIATIDHEEDRLQITVESGEPVSLLLEEPGRWAQFIRSQRRVRSGDEHDDP